MELEDSLLCSQKPASGPYSELDASSPHTLLPYFFKILYNIIFPYTLRSS